MHRKLKATAIFDGTQFLAPGYVLVLNELGKVLQITTESEAGDGVENFDGILCPGFVNAHCHLDLTHLEGKIPMHTGLVDFVQQIVALRGSHLEDVYPKMQAVVEAQYKSGTVAMGDICSTELSLEVKKSSPVYMHNFIEVFGFLPASAPASMSNAMHLYDQFLQLYTTGQNKGNVSYSPHSPYTVSRELFLLLNEKSVQQVVTMHNQETTEEHDFFMRASGKFLDLYKNMGIDISHYQAPGTSSIAAVLPYFNKSQKLILVHNTYTTQEDLNLIKVLATEHLDRLSFCLCINANLYIENQLPPVHLLRRNNTNICLGTDSFASNKNLNIMDEMKTMQEHFPELAAAEILKWATINGAKALGIDTRYGSFEVGKTPGVVLIKQDGIEKISKEAVGVRV